MVTKAKGRPRKGAEPMTSPLALRVESKMIAALDAAAARRTERGGPTWSRADVVRAFLREGLEGEDATGEVA